MKRIKQGLLAASMMLTLGSGSASADPVNFLPSGVPVQFKYNNLENVVTAVGDQLFGIFNISTINDTGGNPYWASGISDGTALTGVFSGLTVAEILNPAPGSFIIYFTGGVLNIYNTPAGSFKPTASTDPLLPQVCPLGVCPAPWLTATFAPGTAINDPTTPFDESTATLVSTITGTLATPTGTGDGLLELTGGTAASRFNDGPGPDFSIQSQLQFCPGTGQFAANCAFNGNTWPVASFDPVIGSTAVPEPASLALLGLALAGLGVSRRKKTTA